MNQNDCIVISILLCNFVNKIYATQITGCPNSNENWEIRAKEVGCSTDKPYECLPVKGRENVFYENCLSDVSYPKGTYPVIDINGKRDVVECPYNRYQNETYRTNQPGLHNCPFIKHNCSGQGQLTPFTNSYSDNICICQEGYRLEYPSSNDSLCRPDEDCNCIEIDTASNTFNTIQPVVENTTSIHNNTDPVAGNGHEIKAYSTILILMTSIFIIFIGTILIVLIRKRRHRHTYKIVDVEPLQWGRNPKNLSASVNIYTHDDHRNIQNQKYLLSTVDRHNDL